MKELNLGDNIGTGYVHVGVGVGVYASTRDPVCTILRKRPTITQLRKDDYQSIGLLERAETVDNINPRSIIGFIDVPASECMPFFNRPRIAEMEQRWESIGKTNKYFDHISEMSVTCGLDLVGSLDALVITPDFNVNYYEVQQAGQVIFSQRLIEPTARRSLGFALLLFEDGVLSYAEVSCHSSYQPSWLQVVSTVPVMFL